MSLFPAYAGAAVAEDKPKSAAPALNSSWLVNPSFEQAALVPPTDATHPAAASPTNAPTPADSAKHAIATKRSHRSHSGPHDDNASSSASSSPDRRHRRRHKKDSKKSKRSRRHDRETAATPAQPVIEFTGSEEYYVDKKSERGFLSVQTLHRPACPKYRSHSRPLAPYPRRSGPGPPLLRYYNATATKRSKVACGDAATDVPTNDRLDEAEFVRQNRDYNQRLGQHADDIDTWLRFVRHQDQTPQRLTKVQLAERKMDILNKALAENLNVAGRPGQPEAAATLAADACDRLYAEYAAVIERAFPSFDVSRLLDGLLAKDPTNCTLWQAQIMASQGSMARCLVPDVLKLYERCMKQMYSRNRYDEVMLKLFTNCCFFLRQAGLAEQLFALLKLTLDLNIRSGHFATVQPSERDQPVLVEYEECILASGLPMNEIWLRIEKLRQNFNFLPCPEDRSCPDPQRIVYAEDVVNFVYPLAQPARHAFDLVVRVLHVLKVPLPVQRHAEHPAHFDAIEDVLAVLLRQPISDCDAFDRALVELVRDFSSGPTYVPSHLGHEIYAGVQSELLLRCAAAMPAHRELLERQWLRLERVRLRLERSTAAAPIGGERAKKLRSQVKALLRRDDNRNAVGLYTEYAWLELELGQPDKMEAILRAAVAQSGLPAAMAERTEVAHACVVLAERLMRGRQFAAATAVLCGLALGEAELCEPSATVAEHKKLLAMRQLADWVRELVAADREATDVALEQHFGDDVAVTWAKAKVYALLMVRGKAAAVEELTVLVRSWPERNARHRFVRERLYEVYADVVLVADRHGNESNVLVFDVLQRGLAEFPENLVLVRFAAMLQGQTWFRIRTLLTRSHSAVSVVFLVAAAKYRFACYNSKTNSNVARLEFGALTSDIDANELTFKQRVCNLLRSCTANKAPELRRNALLWRIYLRSLVDVRVRSFEESRDALFAALDECPWNKALYLDGTVYAPQQVTHIQDLIIEKQLRICALPEELEILRSDDPLAGPSKTAATIKMEPF